MVQHILQHTTVAPYCLVNQNSAIYSTADTIMVAPNRWSSRCHGYAVVWHILPVHQIEQQGGATVQYIPQCIQCSGADAAAAGYERGRGRNNNLARLNRSNLSLAWMFLPDSNQLACTILCKTCLVTELKLWMITMVLYLGVISKSKHLRGNFTPVLVTFLLRGHSAPCVGDVFAEGSFATLCWKCFCWQVIRYPLYPLDDPPSLLYISIFFDKSVFQPY